MKQRLFNWIRRYRKHLAGFLVLFLLIIFVAIFLRVPAVKYCTVHKYPIDYTLCQVDSKDDKTTINLKWKNNKNTPILTFQNLISNSNPVIFAMNAGMYNDKYAPIGYTVIDNKEILSLNLKDGEGNFHLMPNGVFWWDKDGFYITESKTMNELLKSGKKPMFATQSGPMLVIDGVIHPKFNKYSTSYKIRNGVGICGEQVKFVVSDEPVTFYQFADLFKTTLNCQNALFLDGGVASALYSQELKRLDNKQMGVMIVLERVSN